MSLIGSPIKKEDFYIGKWIWLNTELSFHLQALMEHLQDNAPPIKHGLYYVVDIEDNIKNAPNIEDHGKIYLRAKVMHESWDSSVDPLLLVLNKDCAVILAGAIMINDCLFNAIVDVEELIKENKDKFQCVACKKDLNIVMHNVRICNSCESNFDVAELMKNNSNGNEFDNEKDTDPYGFVFGSTP